MYKKGEVGIQSVLSVWWIFTLVVIGGGIVLGSLIYYSTDIDVKEIEAEILGERVISCVVDFGLDRFVSEEDVFSKCGLNENVFDVGSNFYFKVYVYDGSELVNEFGGGDMSFEGDCEIAEKVKVKNFPGCAEKQRIVFDEENVLKVVVKTGSNQVIKKEAVV